MFMASLKAICQASVFFGVSLHDGQGGVGSFQPRELDASWGDLPHGVRDRAHFLLQLHHSLTICLCLDLLRDLFGLVASCSRALISGLQVGLQ